MMLTKDGMAGGITHSTQTGWFGARSSQITISPGLKGYGDIGVRNGVFKHEFMHAWHWHSGFSGWSTYSERATSTFSVAYSPSCREH